MSKLKRVQFYVSSLSNQIIGRIGTHRKFSLEVQCQIRYYSDNINNNEWLRVLNDGNGTRRGFKMPRLRV